MKAPSFWSEPRPGFAALMLSPLGWLYGTLTLRRMGRPGARVGVPVLCVGNFTAGGAGKTPTAIALARALEARGERPVFLTRGYGGSVRAPTLVDRATHSAAEVGGEPLLLAAVAPTVVSPDRVAGARVAAPLGSVVIMDDGLQNPALAKDFTLAVVDAGAGFGNGLCVPAGPLRAPLDGQMGHVDALLTIGMGNGITEAVALGARAGKPVYRSDFSTDPGIADLIGGQRVLAFAGIGRPQKFFETLLGLYAKLDSVHPFADHHAYTEAEASRLLALAQERKLMILTTEKDLVRLTGGPAREALAEAATALPIVLPLPEEIVDLAMGAIRRFRARG